MSIDQEKLKQDGRSDDKNRVKISKHKTDKYYFQVSYTDTTLTIKLLDIQDLRRIIAYQSSFNQDTIPPEINRVFSDLQQLFQFLSEDQSQNFCIDHLNGTISSSHEFTINKLKKKFEWTIELQQISAIECQKMVSAQKIIREHIYEQCQILKKQNCRFSQEIKSARSELRCIKIFLFLMILVFCVFGGLLTVKMFQIIKENQNNKTLRHQFQDFLGITYQEWKRQNLTSLQLFNLMQTWRDIPIDLSLPHINKFKAYKTYIEYVGEKGWRTQLLGRQNIYKINKFSIKIIQVSEVGLSIGITDNKGIASRDGSLSKHVLSLKTQNNQLFQGRTYAETLNKQQGLILKPGDILTVSIDFKNCEITWLQNNTMVFKFKSELLAKSGIVWVPMVVFSVTGDRVQWIPNSQQTQGLEEKINMNDL